MSDDDIDARLKRIESAHALLRIRHTYPETEPEATKKFTMADIAAALAQEVVAFYAQVKDDASVSLDTTQP